MDQRSAVLLPVFFLSKSLGTAAQTVRIGFYETPACIVAQAFVFSSASAPAVGAAAVSQRRQNRSAGSRAPRGFYSAARRVDFS